MPQMETGQQVTVNTVATAGEPYEIEVTPGLVLANVSADGGPIVYWSRSNSVTPNGPGIPVHPGQGFQVDAA